MSLHQVGDCHASRGQFTEALSWLERAVAAKEKDDVHGRVDLASLGMSLHQVGDCYASQGQFAEATYTAAWILRALRRASPPWRAATQLCAR
jgi:hypothetical protein